MSEVLRGLDRRPLKRFLSHLIMGPDCLATHGDHDPLASPPRPFVDPDPTQPFNPGELFHLLNDDEMIRAYRDFHDHTDGYEV